MVNSIDLLKIGSFARLAGTNLRTLRYYEEIGLLRPAQRSKGGFRYYRATDANRVRLIQHLQGLGLHLEEILTLVDLGSDRGTREALVERVRTALQKQDELIGEQIERLIDQRRRVGEARTKLGECVSCEHQPGRKNNFCEPCLHSGRQLPELLSALFQG